MVDHPQNLQENSKFALKTKLRIKIHAARTKILSPPLD